MSKIRTDAKEVITGGSMMAAAFVLAFLMVVGVIEKDLLLSFLAYAVSLAGFAVGVHGVFGLQRSRG
ncbi:MAG: hypothetical protein NYU90_07535 [Aigarchaeota archaeon]|nr:hypothetical protein [Candidatus Calditenuis fumarioli]